MEFDRNGLEILPRHECLRLLHQAHLGRIALCIGALPVVLPVNFCMLDDDVVIRTGPGSKLEAATKNAVVAFEVDSFSMFDHAGWSVLVQGVASELVDRESLERAQMLPLRAWAGDDNNRLVRVRSQLVSGRRLDPTRHSARASAALGARQ